MKKEILKECGAIEQEYFGYPYRIETATGTAGVDLRDNHLFCNFVGSEERAKVRFGHWKQNTLVWDKKDIEQHFKYLGL
jgi:hypothetical protein